VDNNAGLREHLLAEAREFYDMVVHPVRRGSDGNPKLDADGEPIRSHHPEFVPALAPWVESIAAGDEVTLHRYSLPDSHSERDAGLPGDYLILGADDVLRPYR
jgi:hypothetical protein